MRSLRSPSFLRPAKIIFVPCKRTKRGERERESASDRVSHGRAARIAARPARSVSLLRRPSTRRLPRSPRARHCTPRRAMPRRAAPRRARCCCCLRVIVSSTGPMGPTILRLENVCCHPRPSTERARSRPHTRTLACAHTKSNVPRRARRCMRASRCTRRLPLHARCRCTHAASAAASGITRRKNAAARTRRLRNHARDRVHPRRTARRAERALMYLAGSSR